MLDRMRHGDSETDNGSEKSALDSGTFRGSFSAATSADGAGSPVDVRSSGTSARQLGGLVSGDDVDAPQSLLPRTGTWGSRRTGDKPADVRVASPTIA